jgi:iron(III) transport system permease protein
MLRRIHVPILRPSILTALLIVFVDVMKELPATLILRPFNYDTLAVQAHASPRTNAWPRPRCPAS